MSRRLTLLASTLAAMLIAEPVAHASDPAADALFQSGKTLIAEGKITEACEKFEESYKIEPLLGALLNLASCLEQDGRLAAAWSRWGDAVEQAGRQGDDRKGFAEEHRSALEPRVAKLVVSVSGESGDLEVFRDGLNVGKATFNVAIPVDPGGHVIEVARGDDVLHRESLTLKEGEKIEVKLDASEIGKKAPMGRRLGAPSSTVKKSAPPVESSDSTQLIAGLVVGSVGVAAGITGFVFGGLALGKQGEADDPTNCTASHSCTPAGLDLIAESETFAHVSTGLLAGGGALTALGLILVLTAPSSDAAALEQRSDRGPTIRVGLGTGPGDLGLDVRGSF